mgnify:CR=1 FL=1
MKPIISETDAESRASQETEALLKRLMVREPKPLKENGASGNNDRNPGRRKCSSLPLKPGTLACY